MAQLPAECSPPATSCFLAHRQADTAAHRHPRKAPAGRGQGGSLKPTHACSTTSMMKKRQTTKLTIITNPHRLEAGEAVVLVAQLALAAAPAAGGVACGEIREGCGCAEE